MSFNGTQISFPLNLSSISKMLLLPNKHVVLDDESLATDFKDLPPSHVVDFLTQSLLKKASIPKVALPFVENIFLDIAQKTISMVHLVSKSLMLTIA